MPADAVRPEPTFILLMQAEATGLRWADGRVAGVRARTGDGVEHTLWARLVIACDGRGSTLPAGDRAGPAAQADRARRRPEVATETTP